MAVKPRKDRSRTTEATLLSSKSPVTNPDDVHKRSRALCPKTAKSGSLCKYEIRMVPSFAVNEFLLLKT
ncbi:hypothetical protein RUM43_007092 [Polyplax serrata]|uniref:Uncharacterized protein n=1 Tax=Polyplax serrata TaxID=468196 RepID=A0AAN8S179_POLSC